MKKYVCIILMLVIMVSSLCGCSITPVGSVPSGYSFEVKDENNGGVERLLTYENRDEYLWTHIETVKEMYFTGGIEFRLTREYIPSESIMATYYLKFASPNGVVYYSFEERCDWNPEYFAFGGDENGIFRIYISEYDNLSSDFPIMMFAVYEHDTNELYKDIDPENLNGRIPYIKNDLNYYTLAVTPEKFEYKEDEGENYYHVTYFSNYYSKDEESSGFASLSDGNRGYVSIYEEYDTGLTYVVMCSKGNDGNKREEARNIISTVKSGEEAMAVCPFSTLKTVYKVDDDNDYLMSYQVKDNEMVFNSLIYDVEDISTNGMNITWLSPENINGEYTVENGTLTLSDARGEYHFSITKYEGATLDCNTVFGNTKDGLKLYVDDTWLGFLSDEVSRDEETIAEWAGDKVLIPIVTDSGEKGYVVLYKYEGGIYVFQYTEKGNVYDDARAVEVIRSINIKDTE